VARDQMTGERTRAINLLTALQRTVDLGVDARKSLTTTQLATIAGWREREENLARRTCRAGAVRLVRRIKTLDGDLTSNRAGITDLVASAVPELLELPASSGNTVRYRLNRGGDRRLNRALTTIVIVRMRIDPATRAYVARRRAEGRTTKEIMRSLKRYITRQLYRTLATAHPVAAT